MMIAKKNAIWVSKRALALFAETFPLNTRINGNDINPINTSGSKISTKLNMFKPPIYNVSLSRLNKTPSPV